MAASGDAILMLVKDLAHLAMTMRLSLMANHLKHSLKEKIKL
jgi:hypothetical protein